MPQGELRCCSHLVDPEPPTLLCSDHPANRLRPSPKVMHACVPSCLTFSHTTMARRLNRSAAESLNRTVAPYTSPRTSSAEHSVPVPLPLPLLPPLLLLLLLLLLLPGVPSPFLLLGPGPACSCSSRCTEHLLKSE